MAKENLCADWERGFQTAREPFDVGAVGAVAYVAAARALDIGQVVFVASIVFVVEQSRPAVAVARYWPAHRLPSRQIVALVLAQVLQHCRVTEISECSAGLSRSILQDFAYWLQSSVNSGVQAVVALAASLVYNVTFA